jgi:DMSO/TMAO reductase YedYZ heme-binding membrane subunit
MNVSQGYILISIIVLAVIMIVLVLTSKKMQKPLSKMATLAFLFAIAGAVFGDNRLIGYSLMGVGVILAIIDIVKKSKQS